MPTTYCAMLTSPPLLTGGVPAQLCRGEQRGTPEVGCFPPSLITRRKATLIKKIGTLEDAVRPPASQAQGHDARRSREATHRKPGLQAGTGKTKELTEQR